AAVGCGRSTVSPPVAVLEFDRPDFLPVRLHSDKAKASTISTGIYFMLSTHVRSGEFAEQCASTIDQRPESIFYRSDFASIEPTEIASGRLPSRLDGRKMICTTARTCRIGYNHRRKQAVAPRDLLAQPAKKGG